jgi:hypothetical protein
VASDLRLNRGKQNLTISLDRQTIQKAKIIAAQRSTSISELLAGQIEMLVQGEEAYEFAHSGLSHCSIRGSIWVAEFEPAGMICTSGKMSAAPRVVNGKLFARSVFTSRIARVNLSTRNRHRSARRLGHC